MLNKRLITQLTGKMDPSHRVVPAKLPIWAPLCVTRLERPNHAPHALIGAQIGNLAGTTVTIQIVLTGPKTVSF